MGCVVAHQLRNKELIKSAEMFTTPDACATDKGSL